MTFAGWFVFNLQNFFWTLWVASVVYDAEPGSKEYTDAVQWGSMALTGQAGLSFVLVQILPALFKRYERDSEVHMTAARAIAYGYNTSGEDVYVVHTPCTPPPVASGRCCRCNR